MEISDVDAMEKAPNSSLLQLGNGKHMGLKGMEKL